MPRPFLNKDSLLRQRRKLLLKVEEFSALSKLNKSINSILKLPQVLKMVTTKACQIMRAKGYSLRLLQKNKKEFILQAYYGLNKPSQRNIKYDKIPIASRILAVADAYEAMVSHRPYRKTFFDQQACEELKKCLGTQFDPSLGKAFFKTQILSSN